jgi:hypothetical protein
MDQAFNSVATIIANLTSRFTYGDFIASEWFYDQASYDPGLDSNAATQRYARLMDRIHETLREDHMMVLFKIETGYQILPPEQHAAVMVRRLNSGIAAAFREQEAIAKATNRSRLTVEQRQQLTDAENRAQGLKQLLMKRKPDRLG